jgi:DNA-binding CsgD family transcriptional regulator
MRQVDWSKISTEEEAARVSVAALRSVELSGGAFSYTPVGRLPSGRPGLLRRALPLNFDSQAIEDWFRYQDDFVRGPTGSLSQLHDPVRRRMITRILPERFVMPELLENGRLTRNSTSVKWIKTLMGYGIRESYSIPIFTGVGEYWSLAAFRYHDNPNTAPLDHRTLGELYWLAANLADFCADVLNWREVGQPEAARPLAPRELDCLYWAGQGKSAAETAELLEIRTETVRKYLKLAIAKLNAANKTQAVCMAHQLGYIPLA